ncbi:MAG TPA: GTPase domain-containing protein [Methylomusa anaerophila]|uniref:GTPase ObgE n=1 Tax=Methylomusa anaerophila TaxID=1930071 RepID=A0A348APU4_9FIRM|nr:GTPase domain-containing protein [Methylomusa anaerophila]BBB93092.1 GTPase ObgE [Methylomusa anaerophila]HML87075.1 GTPase domain-containing protein [Methylomusa anaerophila]
MRECVIVGKPNSGKTMFALNFAGYLGSKNVDVTFRTYDGLTTCRHYSIDEAKRELCSSTKHKTRCLQSMVLKIAVGKTAVNFKLTDTCGIVEHIHQDEGIRKGMAQTIGLLRYADFIIHIVDLSIFPKYADHTNVDQDFYNYGISKNAYILLANKVDLPAAKENLGKLSAAFPHASIIPVSSLYGQGFKEVKLCVARNI